MYAFELFVSDEFDIRENSDVDEIEFIRRFKLMGMGVKSKMPTKLTAERVVVVPVQTAAKDLCATALVSVPLTKFRFQIMTCVINLKITMSTQN